MRGRLGALALALVLLASRQHASAAGTGFIRAVGGRFADEDCKEFAPTGLNTWQLLEVAAGRVPSKPVQTARGFSDVVQWTLATAAANELSVLRAFGHGVDSAFPLQTKPGKYDERAFKALDYILDEAAKVGVRLILTMADNWSPIDSKAQYVRWSASARGSALASLTAGLVGEAGEPDAFFTDPGCRSMFRDHMAAMTGRRNSINGRLYKEDATIFAWNLMNEPRCDCFPETIPPPPDAVSCRPECAGKLQRWIEEMAAHLKSLDPNHMVTVGEEGFYGPDSPSEPVNPGTGWATLTGQNFSANHAPAAIDFASIHLWPDNWEIWDLQFLDQWLRQHAADAQALGKPLLVEEFGKQVHIETPHTQATITSVRAPFYKRVYATLMQSLQEGGALRGVMFWQFGMEPYVSNSIFGRCRHCEAIQISATDSVFKNVIAPAAQQAQRLAKAAGPVPQCTPVAGASKAAVNPHPLTSQAGASQQGQARAGTQGQATLRRQQGKRRGRKRPGRS